MNHNHIGRNLCFFYSDWEREQQTLLFVLTCFGMEEHLMNLLEAYKFFFSYFLAEEKRANLHEVHLQMCSEFCASYIVFDFRFNQCNTWKFIRSLKQFSHKLKMF